MENLINSEAAGSLYRLKKSEFEEKVISLSEKDEYLEKGYSVKKVLKKRFVVIRPKKHNVNFEDKIWCLFYEMGFNQLNLANFKLAYDDSEGNLTKQIDAFAMDEETIILVECKSAENFKLGNFKDNLEAYNGMKSGLIKNLRKEFPEKKISFIYATNNYDLGQKDKERLEGFGIIHFNENQIMYFSKLADHLGRASKYQLLGLLFTKTKINNLENRVIAIEGKMGNRDYYSFSIEPHNLLKLAFVLHRNNSLRSEDLMPTYQRLIKKNRLSEIKEFVNNGGFFPNSIILSINSKTSENLRFESFPKSNLNSKTRAGILYLPQTYQSCYIIDGQHRLYGYFDSDYAQKDVIPVIAFVNLEKDEQVKMFMDINQNQKPVPKALRNTLDIDLLWESEDLEKRKKALLLSIAQSLGEDKNSPMYKHILTGENTKTHLTNLTLENIKNALNKTKFFNLYNKQNTLVYKGFFDYGNNDDTQKLVLSILNHYFKTIISDKELEQKWKEGERSYISTNNVVSALILLLNDYFELLNNKKPISLDTNLATTLKSIDNFIFAIQGTLLNIKEDNIRFIKSQKGGSAPIEVWKRLGYLVNLTFDEFEPEWLNEYVNQSMQDNASETNNILNEFLVKLRTDFTQILIDQYGQSWEREGVPLKTYERLASMAASAKHQNSIKITNFLDVATFTELYQISTHRGQWSNLFKLKFQDSNKLFSEEVNPLNKLSNIYIKTSKGQNVSKTDFENLKKFVESFINLK